jgi:hypothetical protein
MPVVRQSAALAALAALALATTACGASLPTSAETAAADTAEQVCGLLRGWSNEMAASLNATSDAITADDDPATADDVLLDGFDDLIAIAEEHVTEAGEIDLPASGDRDRLAADLRAGAEAAVDELESQRAEIEDLPPIEVDDQQGVMGGAFVSLEKAQSLVEPEIVGYDDEEVRAAFNAEPTCEHVIQRF